MYFNPFLTIFFQQKRDTSLKEASLTLYLPTTASQSDVRPLFSKAGPDGGVWGGLRARWLGAGPLKFTPSRFPKANGDTQKTKKHRPQWPQMEMIKFLKNSSWQLTEVRIY